MVVVRFLSLSFSLSSSYTIGESHIYLLPLATVAIPDSKYLRCIFFPTQAYCKFARTSTAKTRRLQSQGFTHTHTYAQRERERENSLKMRASHVMFVALAFLLALISQKQEVSCEIPWDPRMGARFNFAETTVDSNFFSITETLDRLDGEVIVSDSMGFVTTRGNGLDGGDGIIAEADSIGVVQASTVLPREDPEETHIIANFDKSPNNLRDRLKQYKWGELDWAGR